LAGKRSSDGTFSRSQKLRKRVKANEYPAIVEGERLFWIVLFSELRALEDKKRLTGLGGSEDGFLKSKFLRAWTLVDTGLRRGVKEDFFELLPDGGKGLLHEGVISG
jgi:hypothetical protein